MGYVEKIRFWGDRRKIRMLENLVLREVFFYIWYEFNGFILYFFFRRLDVIKCS